MLTGTTGTRQHYHCWSLRNVGPAGEWVGAFTPDRLVLELILEGVFLDLDLLGITGTAVGQTAILRMVAVPEPAAALGILAGLLACRCAPRSRRTGPSASVVA